MVEKKQGMNKNRAYTVEALPSVIFCDNKRMIDCVTAMNNNTQYMQDNDNSLNALSSTNLDMPQDVPKMSLSSSYSFPHRLARGADELEAS